MSDKCLSWKYWIERTITRFPTPLKDDVCDLQDARFYEVTTRWEEAGKVLPSLSLIKKTSGASREDKSVFKRTLKQDKVENDCSKKYKVFPYSQRSSILRALAKNASLTQIRYSTKCTSLVWITHSSTMNTEVTANERKPELLYSCWSLGTATTEDRIITHTQSKFKT